MTTAHRARLCPKRLTRRVGLALRPLLGCALLLAPTVLQAQRPREDSVTVTEVVALFRRSLTSGDSVRAVSVLANDLIVMEGGSAESYAEYLGHHLAADIKASRSSNGERTITRVTVIGDAAFLTARTLTPGTTTNPQGSESAELMVLSRSAAGWRIRAIHWSSRRRRA